MDESIKSLIDIQLRRKELRMAAAEVKAFLQRENVTCEVNIKWIPNWISGPAIALCPINTEDPRITEDATITEVLHERNINGFNEDDKQRTITITRPENFPNVLLTFSSTEAYESVLARLRALLRDESSDSGKEHSSSGSSD